MDDKLQRFKLMREGERGGRPLPDKAAVNYWVLWFQNQRLDDNVELNGKLKAPYQPVGSGRRIVGGVVWVEDHVFLMQEGELR